MKRLEFLATIGVLIAILGTTAAVFGYEAALEKDRDCITIHMRTYEHGNPVPNVVHLKVGEPACLRLTSDDTMHGFNIPDLGIFSEDIQPGKWTYVRFTPEEAGTFSYVCYIVCSPMHSRVRGQLIIDG